MKFQLELQHQEQRRNEKKTKIIQETPTQLSEITYDSFFSAIVLKGKNRRKKTSTLFTLQIDAFHNIATKRRKKAVDIQLLCFFLSQ